MARSLVGVLQRKPCRRGVPKGSSQSELVLIEMVTGIIVVIRLRSSTASRFPTASLDSSSSTRLQPPESIDRSPISAKFG
jgi:hypothetical protein